MPPINLKLNPTYRSGAGVDWRIKQFQILPPNKFQLNPTYRSGADVVSRLPRWPPSWILKPNEFSNSKSPCHPNVSCQVWAQSDIPFWSRRGLKIFKMATVAAILDIRTAPLYQFWISMLIWCLPLSFDLIQITVREERSFEDFQDGRHGGHLGYRNGMILAILNLHVAPIDLGLILLGVREQMWFQDGGHLR